jgi:hypothetical protein
MRHERHRYTHRETRARTHVEGLDARQHAWEMGAQLGEGEDEKRDAAVSVGEAGRV